MNITKTKLISGLSIFVGLLLVVSGIITYMVSPQREVDSVVQNSPLDPEIITINQKLPLLDKIKLAAGIAYDTTNDRFFISTDEPHSFIKRNGAYFFVLNSRLDTIEFEIEIQADGDLEGVTCIDGNTAVVVSEPGTLIYLVDKGDNNFVITKSVSIFNDSRSHKLGSLAYDHDQQHIYTAEKEGKKTIYKLDQDGNLLQSFDLKIADNISPIRSYSLDTDYTIAGMTYADGYLYIFSEAYSTIFKFNIETQKVEDVFGVDQLPEVAGITLKQDDFYLVGDFEEYLPKPEIHIVSRSSAY